MAKIAQIASDHLIDLSILAVVIIFLVYAQR